MEEKKTNKKFILYSLIFMQKNKNAYPHTYMSNKRGKL